MGRELRKRGRGRSGDKKDGGREGGRGRGHIHY